LGGSGQGNQWDCSGFSQAALSKDGKSIPRTSAAQYASAQKISKSQLQAGDLVFYGNGRVSHVAVYVGNGQIAHARNPSAGLSVNSLDTYSQYNNVIGYGRY
jgi:cell wall-associated NlpC family hydrolase